MRDAESLWDVPSVPAEPDAESLAVKTAVKAAILLADPLARTSVPMWKRAERLASRLLDRLDPPHHPDLRSALAQLGTAPRDVGHQRHLAAVIGCQLSDSGQWPDGLTDALAEFIERNRVDVWVGPDYRCAETPRPCTRPHAVYRPAGVQPDGPRDLCLVVDFRDAAGEPGRLRNLAATLLSISDQSLDRSRYRVVCVEADSEPRHRGVVEGLCDRYIHAPSGGPYNRSWAHNVGVVHGAGAGDRYLCFLDADVLLGREHLEQFVSAVAVGNLSAFLPHSSLLYLDDASTALILGQRMCGCSRKLDYRQLFGYRIPSRGGCLLVRADLFRQVCGFDERYCGWGDEDNDVVRRLSAVAPVHSGAGFLPHLNHGRPRMEVGGRRTNEWLIGRQDWHEENIGDLSKYQDRV